MAQVQWRMKGEYLKNCSCNAGCPCDFNREPTRHVCETVIGMNIVEGNYGSVPLNGLRWAVTGKWPGPLNEGNGTIQPFIDARAHQRQREALLQILSGQAGGTFFTIVKAIVSKLEEPQFVPIDFEFDLKRRRARMAVRGAFETVTEPVKSPVTGEEHHVQVCLPDGFEYKVAEIGNAAVMRSTGAIKFNWPNGHSSLAQVEHTPAGLKA